MRRGAFIAPNVVLMPSYVNIGAYVDSGTMVDTWATVGSCAQIGKNVHLSGGVGIGGVLEPLQANPTIIEDDCFIGARSEIVEGVVVESGAVISMGVFIGQSTRIYDREQRHDHLRPRAGRFGRGARHAAVGRRQVRALLRGHRQARRCPDPRQDLAERAAAQHRLNRCSDHGRRRSAESAGDVVLGQLLLRIGEHQVRRADLHQIAQVKVGRALRDACRLLHVVGHDRDGVIPPQLVDQILDASRSRSGRAPSVGSSIRITSGLTAMVRAMHRRCC